jgi:hypothetical protein
VAASDDRVQLRPLAGLAQRLSMEVGVRSACALVLLAHGACAPWRLQWSGCCERIRPGPLGLCVTGVTLCPETTARGRSARHIAPRADAWGRNADCFSEQLRRGGSRREGGHFSTMHAFETVPTHGRRPWGGVGQMSKWLQLP